MSAVKIFNAIGDFCNDTVFILYDNIGNVFNYSCIVLGFVGLFYWLNLQRKFNNDKKNHPYG